MSPDAESTKAERDAEFVEFVAARRRTLLTAAYFRCGDWHRAEDLLQTALTKLYIAWPKVIRKGTEDAYVRRIIVNLSIDESRSPSRREQAFSVVPDTPVHDTSGYEDTSALMTAMSTLPDQQRRVVILRYWLQLSVEETANDLGVSTGTVKSQCARAMERMRHALAATYAPNLAPAITEETA